ncbi:phage holin [Enterococcus sp. LJL90]
MKKINWKVRFNKHNLTFVIRFIGALLVPILVYMGLEVTDLTSWSALGDVFVSAISNPYLVGLTVLNAINLIPDPTTKGVGDSVQALTYEAPKEKNVQPQEERKGFE